MVKQQYEDNLKWIKEAKENNLVVGSQARILYSNEEGRIKIALAFNKAIASGKLQGPVVLSRDHHDVSGTDSPFRETANIYDGSQFCADMAIQNVIGGSFRGATWVAIHNGGGVGWGDVINGGFGLVLDGTDEVAEKAKAFLTWDVLHGVARRSWSGNPKAQSTISSAMAFNPNLKVTVPFPIDDKKILELDM
jgi:urocanate hydratase